MNKKTFTIIKVGYTAGAYGCSGEYFKLTLPINKKNPNWSNEIFFHGMYGSEERVARILKDSGFIDLYSQSIYSQLTRKDIPKNRFLNEADAIIAIKAMICQKLI